MIAYNDGEVIILANAKSAVNVKIDAGIKELAASFLERMGIDQTTAIEMYYRQIIKEKGLPFKPAVALTIDEQLAAAIEAKRIPVIDLAVDENRRIIVDKNKDPAVYDWLVDG
jgi:addiction module RelB/DinJ family antitoxin